MSIPAINTDGLLPAGVFDCTLPELRERFGRFQVSDQRTRLFARLEELVVAMQRSGLFEALLVDGSFVTAKPVPNDIDLVAVLRPGHDFERDLPMSEYASSPAPCCDGNLASMWSLPNAPASFILAMLNSSAGCVKIPG